MRWRSCYRLAPFFRGGDWECRAYYVFCSEERCKYTHYFRNTMQKSEKSCIEEENLLWRNGEKTGRLSKYFADASQKRSVNARNAAERFLFVVGASYLYSGSNNKRESAGKNMAMDWHCHLVHRRKWSIKPSLAEKMVDILEFVADKDEFTTD